MGTNEILKRAFTAGDIVKWTGQAQGGRKDHEGQITRVAGLHAEVTVPRRHKKTGAELKPQRYRPYLSQLVLVKSAPKK